MEYIRTALFLPLSVPSTRYIFHQILLIYVPQTNDCQSLQMIVNPCIERIAINTKSWNHCSIFNELCNIFKHSKNTSREASSSLHLFFFLVRFFWGYASTCHSQLLDTWIISFAVLFCHYHFHIVNVTKYILEFWNYFIFLFFNCWSQYLLLNF